MEIRWLGEVCSALPSSGGRGHSCDSHATDRDPLRGRDPLRHLDIGQSPFPRGKSGVSLRAVLSNAPEQAGTGGSRLPALGWEPLWGRSLLAMGIPVDRPMIGGGSLLAMGIPCCWPGSRWCFGA